MCNGGFHMTARMHVVYDDEFGGIRLIAENEAGQLIVRGVFGNLEKVLDTPGTVLKARTFATARGIPTSTSVELIPVVVDR